ncbi:MAG: hypothetical protein QXP98_01655 [Thermoproteus sp.]
MLSKKADLKNSELLGVLGASILCAKQGCEADGPEVIIGQARLKLYSGAARIESKKGTAKGQLSLLDIAKGGRPQKAPQERPKKPAVEPAKKASAPAVEASAPPSEVVPQKEAKKKQEPREAPRGSERREEKQEGPRGEARLEDLDFSKLVERTAEALGISQAETRRVLEAMLSYLSSYPSVGILRFLEDIKRSTKADPDLIKRALNVLRGYEIVELHELGVVNLKKRIDVKRETKL